jgi:hypothetical protein
VTLRARWVTLRARWVTLRARWVTRRARWVTRRARWVTLRLGLHHLSYQAQQKQAAADNGKEIQDAKGGEDPHTPTVSPITLASRQSVAFSSVAHCATPPTSHAATPSLSPGGTEAAAAAVTAPPNTFHACALAAAAASGGGGRGGDFQQEMTRGDLRYTTHDQVLDSCAIGYTFWERRIRSSPNHANFPESLYTRGLDR